MEIPTAVRILLLLLLTSFRTPAGAPATTLPKVTTENVHQNISNVGNEAEKNLEDWLDNLLLDWGLPGWARFRVKARLLILLIVFIASIAVSCLRCVVHKMIHNLTLMIISSHGINRAAIHAIQKDKEEPEELVSIEVDENNTLPPERYRPFPPPVDEWSTDQEDEI